MLCMSQSMEYSKLRIKHPRAENSFINHNVLIFVEHHEIHLGPLLEPVQVSLDGMPPPGCVDCTTPLGVSCELAEGAIDPTIDVTDVKEHQFQD